MEKTRTTVNIGGHEYAIAGIESEEYIHKVAIYVDKKMSEIKANTINLNTTMLAILTSINVADDLIKTQEKYAMVASELQSVQEELKRLKIENALLKEEKKEMRSAPVKRTFDGYK